MKTMRDVNTRRPRSKIGNLNLSQKLISNMDRSTERMTSNDSARHSKKSSTEMRNMRIPSSKGGRQAAIRAKSKMINNRNASGISQTASGANSTKNGNLKVQSTKQLPSQQN